MEIRFCPTCKCLLRYKYIKNIKMLTCSCGYCEKVAKKPIRSVKCKSLICNGKVIKYNRRTGGIKRIRRLKETFICLWNSKRQEKDIAKDLGISVPSVRRLRKHYKLENKYSNNHPARKELIQKAIEMYTGEKPVGTIIIARRLGLHDETVRRYLHESGIPIRCAGNGLTKEKIADQNNIIKEMYGCGKTLKEISKLTGVGKHGIDKRLTYMGVPRLRHPYCPLSLEKNADIKKMFESGKNLAEISQITGLNMTTIKYRITKAIFKDCEFKLSWRTEGSRTWKTSVNTVTSIQELKKQKNKVSKLSKAIEFRVIAEEKIKPKHVITLNN